MKTTIFTWAINNRYKLKFLYNLNEVVLEPYLTSTNKQGKKVIYGRNSNTKEIRVFEYDKIYNLKVLNFNKFSPLIPILYN